MCSLGQKQHDGFPWWLSGKESACNAGDHLHCWICGFDTWVGKIPLKKEMATHSSILTWEIPWTEEPSGLWSVGPQRVGHNLATKLPPPPIESHKLMGPDVWVSQEHRLLTMLPSLFFLLQLSWHIRLSSLNLDSVKL